MPRSKSSISRRLTLPVLLVAGALAACTHWSTVRGPVDQVIRDKQPKKMLITRADGSVLEMTAPRIENDSVVGLAGPTESLQRVAIPVQDIRRVEIRTIDGAATALLVAGLGVTVAAIVSAASQDPPPPRPSGSCVDCFSSCPMVYSWDGRAWKLDSGTFGGAFLKPLSRTDLDNLDFVRAADGLVRLKLANELHETDYIDALSVLVVDHEPGISIAPDGYGAPHALGDLTLPVSAVDYRGNDALARVVSRDGWNWESSVSGRDTAVAEDLRDGLELVFPRSSMNNTARLVVDGNNSPWAAYLIQQYVDLHGSAVQAWYDAINAQPTRAVELGRKLAQDAFLSVAVWTGDRWEKQGLIWEAGPEIVKRQVFSLDLSRVPGDEVRIRLESIPSFWLIDQVAIDDSPEQPFTVREVFAETATGAAGNDVGPLLSAIDRESLVLETGDYAELSFRVPEVSENREHSFLVRSTGWYRIHSSATGEPEVATLDRIANEPGAIARLSVARMNDALTTMASQ